MTLARPAKDLAAGVRQAQGLPIAAMRAFDNYLHG
jgi:hypothetical protein